LTFSSLWRNASWRANGSRCDDRCRAGGPPDAVRSSIYEHTDPGSSG